MDSNLLCRLQRRVISHQHHSSALRVSVGIVGRQMLRTCQSNFRGPSGQRNGKRLYCRRADVVQSEREVTVSAQSQVSSTVSTVSRRTRQMWTATCPQRHRTRFVDTTNHFSQKELKTKSFGRMESGKYRARIIAKMCERRKNIKGSVCNSDKNLYHYYCVLVFPLHFYTLLFLLFFFLQNLFECLLSF